MISPSGAPSGALTGGGMDGVGALGLTDSFGGGLDETLGFGGALGGDFLSDHGGLDGGALGGAAALDGGGLDENGALDGGACLGAGGVGGAGGSCWGADFLGRVSAMGGSLGGRGGTTTGDPPPRGRAGATPPATGNFETAGPAVTLTSGIGASLGRGFSGGEGGCDNRGVAGPRSDTGTPKAGVGIGACRALPGGGSEPAPPPDSNAVKAPSGAATR
jgi:hypothetical protein